jgi:hypothetical protein
MYYVMLCYVMLCFVNFQRSVVLMLFFFACSDEPSEDFLLYNHYSWAFYQC